MSAKRSTGALNPENIIETTRSFEHWFEEHWKQVAAWVGVAVALVLAFYAFRGWSDSRIARTQAQLDEGLSRFAAAVDPGADRDAAYADALASFESAAKGSGGASDVAEFYRGLTLLRLNRPEEAIAALEQAASGADAPIVAKGARSALVQAYLSMDRRDDARATLQSLAEGEDAYAAQALLTLAGLDARAGDTASAEASYRQVIERFPNSPLASVAQRELPAANVGIE